MEGVRIGAKQLGQLAPEVGDVGGVALFSDNLAASLLELGDGLAPYALGVVGRLVEGGQLADAVGPEQVAGVDAKLCVAHRGPEDVVSGFGDVRVGRQPGEHHDAFLLRHRRSAEHGAAARGTKDDLHTVHVGELIVRGDGVLGVAFRVFDNELDHAPIDTAGGVDLVDGQLLGLIGDGAVGLAGTRERLHHAYPEGLIFSAVAVTGNHRRYKNRQ